MKKIGIVGGGASGMVAAIIAARLGCEVTLLERQNRIGKKILVTGNGRCNITNTYVTPEHFHTSSKEDYFLPIKKVSPNRVLDFFKELGIVPLVEKGKVYPLSEQAASVVDVLRMEIERLGITVMTDSMVKGVKPLGQKWQIELLEDAPIEVDKVIMATGGLAAPKLGCDDTGYGCVKHLGHTVVTPLPTLVHVTSTSNYCKMMKGTRITCDATIYVKGKKKRTENGEVLFTEDGLSGPAIFQLSRTAAQASEEKKEALIKLDFFPQITEEEMIGMCYDRIGLHPHKTIEEMLIGWVNKRMISPIMKQAAIGSMHALCENLDYDMIIRLVEVLKGFEIEVSGTRGFGFAQATAGGINLQEINLETMESKVAKGIYLVGELVDVDGDCGGYNLQWAWSSGYLAAYSAAEVALPEEEEIV